MRARRCDNEEGLTFDQEQDIREMTELVGRLLTPGTEAQEPEEFPQLHM